MKDKGLLMVLAVIGTAAAWIIVNNLVVPVSIWQFLVIELTITLMHELYNVAKNNLINN
jgi:hypothetical protein